jgi:hypothetical protein
MCSDCWSYSTSNQKVYTPNSTATLVIKPNFDWEWIWKRLMWVIELIRAPLRRKTSGSGYVDVSGI